MPLVVALAPMRTELSPIVKRLGLTRSRRHAGRADTWTGRCGSFDVVAAVAGVGTAHAAEVAGTMIDRFGPDHVVVAGVAGGLADHLTVGDLVVPAVVHDLDTGTSHHAHPLGARAPEGELVTSNQLHGWDVLEAHAAAGVLAVDMETSAVAAVCEGSDVPWTAIRALSDVVRDGTVDGSTLGFVREDGSTDLGGVARHVARNPARVRELAVMGRDAGRATAAVAQALQEGLAGTAT